MGPHPYDWRSFVADVSQRGRFPIASIKYCFPFEERFLHSSFKDLSFMVDLSVKNNVYADVRTSVFSAIFSSRGSTMVDIRRSLYSSDIAVTKCFVDDQPIFKGSRLNMYDSCSDSNTCLTNVGADSRLSQYLQILVNTILREDRSKLKMNSGGIEIDLLNDVVETFAQLSDTYSN